MLLYSASAMRRIDASAIGGMGIPSLRLMENAGDAVVGALLRRFRDELGGGVVVLCGKGNNGGDGMVVARLLRGAGYAPLVLLLSPPESLAGDCAAQFRRLGPAGVAWEVLPGTDALPTLRSRLAHAGLAVDAILGTGTQGAVAGWFATAIGALNESGLPVASVDIPSGLPGDGLAPVGPCVRADLTVTLALPKACLYTPECAPYCGEVVVADIGIPAEALRGEVPVGEGLDANWAAPFFRPREMGTHKGDCGRVLLVAGGRGHAGAAFLAARGGLRAGAGLLTVAGPSSSVGGLAASLPEAMSLPLPETSEGTLSMDALASLLEAADASDAVGIGPGLGTFPETAALLRELSLRLFRPAVLDADALNALAGHGVAFRDPAAPRILTPHPGEMARLTAKLVPEVVAERYELVPREAGAWNSVVVLKGSRSLVGAPGRPWRMNLSGGPHMAAPGMGDVLTGVIAALLARGLDPFDAASLAVWWHGAAADLAFERLGGYGLLASEVADALPAVEGHLRDRSDSCVCTAEARRAQRRNEKTLSGTHEKEPRTHGKNGFSCS
jgi:NAD(P)H-hydrate epimerase